LGYWLERLLHHGVRFDQPVRRFDETVVAISDPDGIAIELVAQPETPDGEVWKGSPVPSEHAIRGISSVTLSERSAEVAENVLTNLLGFEKVEEENGRTRYLAAGSGGSFADVVALPGGAAGQTAVGTVHHVAWRAPDDETQEAWREELEARGLHVTPVLDRNYFRSIYFREPGGVLFEITTDPPGFAVDEDPDHLGEDLKLPPWLEKDRERIEEILPPVHLPHEEG
jgi:glyoxalase family protein